MHNNTLYPQTTHPPSVTPQNLSLPNQSMQNHIHELAKSLPVPAPAPRKQNTACDACRSRKVKCNRLPGHEKCQHCLTKNYPCTHFVQQATSEKKRASVHRRPRNISSNLPYTGVLKQLFSPTEAIPLAVRYGFCPPITLSTPTREVLNYVFAPPDNANDPAPFTSQIRTKSVYEPWGELAYKLEDDKFKAEFALDLVEVFFQIVHTRIPLLNPAQFRSRLQLYPTGITNTFTEKPLHPALVATVLAWGSKFSEHPLLVADRRRPGGQSMLAKTLIDRARDLGEALKVHRVATPDHVVIGLLIEPLQNQNPDDPSGFHGFWLTCATRHLLELGINHKSVMANIQDPESRGTMIFAWWMACISDAYASAYYRRKPVLDDFDYDIDFYTVDPIPTDTSNGHATMPSPREQLEFLGYYKAAHSLARTARHMSKQLWRPSVDSDGVPYDVLCGFVQDLTDWRDQFLNLVGVPSNFEGEWDFVSAVSSCASDATYHVMWIILFNAVDDYGVKEVNSPTTSAQTIADIEGTKRRVADEALHGALRIAGLAGVLTSNGYLRLDPAVMHVSCIQAGTLLARLGRPEVQNCISGLDQYSYAYEEAGDQAAELRRVYGLVRAGTNELNHMSSAVTRTTPTPPPPSLPQQTIPTSLLAEDQVMRNGSPHHASQQYNAYSHQPQSHSHPGSPDPSIPGMYDHDRW